jgi:hypothetical protein
MELALLEVHGCRVVFDPGLDLEPLGRIDHWRVPRCDVRLQPPGGTAWGRWPSSSSAWRQITYCALMRIDQILSFVESVL